MSYTKAMKHINGHRKDRFFQPIFGMPFNGLKEGEHIESYSSMAKRTATGYNVRVSDNIHDEFIQITEEFKTENEAVIYIDDNKLHDIYKLVRVYSTEGMKICGW